MASATSSDEERIGNLYGVLAYASVVLTCFAGFFAPQYYYGSERAVPLTFALGAVYAAVGVVIGNYTDRLSPWGRAAYYGSQCLLLTIILIWSPARGYMGILVLPLLSQAILDVPWRYSVLIGVYLFGLNMAVWAVPYGWSGATRALMNYFAAFAFTIVFTIITKQAVFARKREAKLREEVQAANQLLRDHAAQTEDLATTRERNRVAREIHDGVGHYLTVVKTQLDAAAGLLPSDPERAREAVIKSARLAGEALEDVRRSVGALRTDAARPPLPEALHTLAQDSGLPVQVRLEGVTRPLNAAVEHALYRAAQEGLTNIRKHAAATAAEVVIDFRTPGRVTLAVTDNGGGVAASTGGGFGLVGIRERIEVLGGRVASGPHAPGGFVLSIEVPA